VVMRNEDYGRIARLLADGTPVELEFNIENKVYPEGRTSYQHDCRNSRHGQEGRKSSCWAAHLDFVALGDRRPPTTRWAAPS